MCTVIFIPAENGALFASCRDENPARQKAAAPSRITGNTGQMIYSLDKAGGTWAGLHEEGTVIILLNGAFKDHFKKKHYRKSRGLIVTQLMDNKEPVLEWRSLDLRDIEPFTLVMLFRNILYELRWDGNEKYKTIKNISQPHIWSSATLYDEAVQEMRQGWFDAGVKAIHSAADLCRFLHTQQDAANGFIMKRNELIQTLSISILQHKNHIAGYEYYDLLQETQTSISMKLASNFFYAAV